jgi:hypothetical protein
MKRVPRLGLVALFGFVALGMTALLWLESLTKTAIEKGGSHALGVETSLERARMGILAGEFAIDGLAVANPPGFAQPNFFSLRSARLELPLVRLLRRRIMIPTLELEGISVDLERSAQGTNFGLILERLSRSPNEDPASEPAPSSSPSRVFHVQRLSIRDVRATVQLLPAGGDLTKLDLAIPPIEVTDLASDMTLPQLCAVVVELVLSAAIEAGQGSWPTEFLAELRGGLDGLEAHAREELVGELRRLEDRLSAEAHKLGPEAEKALQKASEELGGKLDGLLNRKRE